MGELSVGAHTYGTPELQGQMNTVTIGKYCSIAAGVKIDCGWNHDVKAISTYPFKAMWDVGHYNNVCRGDVTIGNDVWIGFESIVMSGVTIGDGVVIGARSIITKDIPNYSIVVGNNRITGQRFNREELTLLNEMQWWNWSDYEVKEAVPLLLSNDIKKLYDYFIHVVLQR